MEQQEQKTCAIKITSKYIQKQLQSLRQLGGSWKCKRNGLKYEFWYFQRFKISKYILQESQLAAFFKQFKSKFDPIPCQQHFNNDKLSTKFDIKDNGYMIKKQYPNEYRQKRQFALLQHIISLSSLQHMITPPLLKNQLGQIAIQKYHENLTQFLRRNNNLSLQWRIKISIQLAELLVITHTHFKIVHNDLKPDNIVVKINQKEQLVDLKLIDFDNSSFIGEIAKPGQCITKPFCAPQLFRYCQRKDFQLHSSPEQDIFSLGHILSLIFFGVHPVNFSIAEPYYMQYINDKVRCLLSVKHYARADRKVHKTIKLVVKKCLGRMQERIKLPFLIAILKSMLAKQ